MKVPAPLIPNALGQVGYLNGTIAPTTVAAVLSAAAYSGATAATSSTSFIFISFELSMKQSNLTELLFSSDINNAQSNCCVDNNNSSTNCSSRCSSCSYEVIFVISILLM